MDVLVAAWVKEIRNDSASQGLKRARLTLIQISPTFPVTHSISKRAASFPVCIHLASYFISSIILARVIPGQASTGQSNRKSTLLDLEYRRKQTPALGLLQSSFRLSTVPDFTSRHPYSRSKMPPRRAPAASPAVVSRRTVEPSPAPSTRSTRRRPALDDSDQWDRQSVDRYVYDSLHSSESLAERQVDSQVILS